MEKNIQLQFKDTIQNIEDFCYFDEDFFNVHCDEFQNLAYICINYCKIPQLLSGIMQKLAFSVENIQLSENDDYQDTTQTLIGFYAENLIFENSNLLDFITNCIIENCPSIKVNKKNDKKMNVGFGADYMPEKEKIVLRDIIEHLAPFVEPSVS